ncbi:ABC transporter ATP-binding protein [Arthrobacter ginkgonis]|uniref:ABC transporter ATP-binding protein n=1 Tax=Arthrobacter ginkgonis TaxID=1630594 RepID=A0ABP7C6A5_9MICC
MPLTLPSFPRAPDAGTAAPGPDSLAVPPIATAGQALRHALTGEGRGLRLAAAGALLMLHQVCEALVPVMIGVAVDRAIAPGNPVAMAWSLAGLAAVFVVLTASWRMGFRLNTRVFGFGEHSLRQAVLDRVVRTPGPARTHGPGRILSIASSDTSMTAGLSWTVARQLAAFSALATSAVALLLISWPLGLGVLAATALFLAAMHLVTRPLERRTYRQQAAAAEATQMATDLVTGLRVLQGAGAVGVAAQRYRDASRGSLAAAMTRARSNALFNAVTVSLSGLFLAGIAWVAATQALAGTITVGELVAVVGLAQFVRDPMSWMAFFAADLAEKRAAARRVAEAVGAPAGDGGVATGASAYPNARTEGALLAVRIDAAPAPEAAPAPLWEIVLHPGRITGLAVDGAAAQRLAGLLSGELPAVPGELDVLGSDATTLAPEELRRRVFVAEHGAAVFSGSVRHNLGAGEVRSELLEAAAADEVLQHLQGGLEAEVGEQGRLLSGGQRQRLLLARALHQPQPVLVLHEPASAVDPVTEARIAAALRSVRPSGLLLITTSPLLLGACDAVLHPPAGFHAPGPSGPSASSHAPAASDAPAADSLATESTADGDTHVRP